MRGPDGKLLPVTLRGGTVWPRVRLRPGERLTVTVEIRRPSWIGWLVGGQEKRTMTVVTPAAHIRSTLLRPHRGTPVTVRFVEPVSRVAVGNGQLRRLRSGRSEVPLGIRAAGRATAGTTTVAAAVRPWETLSQPARVSWFVPGSRTSVVAEPSAGSRIAPLAPLTLTFARPVSSVLGSRLPTRWTNNEYAVWDGTLDARSTAQVSYALASPPWDKLGGRMAAQSKRYQLRVTLSVGGSQRTVEKTSIMPVQIEPVVVT